MSAQSDVDSSPAKADISRWRWRRSQWIMLAVLVALAVLVLVPGVFVFGIIDPSDGLYTECSREMIERHDMLTPYFNYEPFYEKPILIYWAIIASYKLFGISAWAARLPSALSGVLCVGSLFALSRPFIGNRAAFIGSVMLLSAPLFAVVGHLALTDMLLTLFVTCATLCLFGRLHGGSISLLGVAYLCLGLAMLAKGPVALFLVGTTLLCYMFLSGKNKDERWHQYWWRQICRLHPLAGLIIIAAISAPWYIAECSATQGQFFQEFFIRQNVGRATGAVNHQNPWYFYVPYLFGGFFPWWLFLAFAWRLVANVWRKRTSAGGVRQLSLLCLCWSVLVVGLFSAVKTKLPTYILPALPPLALLSGIAVQVMLGKGRRAPLLAARTTAAIGAVVSVAMPIAFVKMHGVSIGTQLVFCAGALLLTGSFTACSLLLRINRQRSAVYCAAVGTALSVALLIPAALHEYDKKQHRPFRQLLRICLDQHANVATFLRDSPAANFYLARPVPILSTKEDFRPWIKAHPGEHYVLLTKDVLKMAQERVPALKLVQQRSKWYLFSIE